MNYKYILEERILSVCFCLCLRTNNSQYFWALFLCQALSEAFYSIHKKQYIIQTHITYQYQSTYLSSIHHCLHQEVSVLTYLDIISWIYLIYLPETHMVLPVVMYGCESWTVKKAERRRIDAFELWCWRLLRVPWTARRSALGVHWKDWCWSLNSNTLATSCKELSHWKRLWCWEGLGAGGEGDDRGWDVWMASLTRWTWI